MIGFSFILTEKCNWKCEYCYFSNISKQSEPRFETFQNHLPYIKKIIDNLSCHGIQVNIDIQGGEVGTIPLDLIQYVFQTLQYPITVSTNGEFLKNEYHLDEKIRPFIKMIMWHLSTDLISHDYKDDEIFISKGIVHHSVDEIVSFVRTNDHIMFDYIEFEFDIKEKRKINFLMYHQLLNRLATVSNVTDNAISILERRLMEKEDMRSNCRKYNGAVVIDMVNENICLCQRQPNDSFPLNKLNLITRLKTFPVSLFEGKSCDTCTRLYSGKMAGTKIQTSMKLRSIL